MSAPGVEGKTSLPLYRTERVIASLTMAWVIILTTYMIFEDHALSHTSIYFLKIILALSGAVMLATLPGFFDVNYSLGGFSVRAAGGAAAFVFIYTQSPNLPSFDVAPAKDAPHRQEKPVPKKPGGLSSRVDGFPVLMALAISPSMMVPAPARPGYSGASAQAGVGTEAGIGKQGGEAVFGATTGRLSIGEAVGADFQALASTVATYARNALHMMKGWLDVVAGALRRSIGQLLTAAKNLLGLDAAIGETPVTIGVLEEDVTARLDTITDPLPGPVGQTIEGLLVGLNDLGSWLDGGLSHTVSGVVGITEQTVGTVLTGVQDTSHQLLDGTDRLVGGVTGLLNDTTGGLTSGLTAPVQKLTGGVTGTTGKLVDRAIPTVETTTGSVLQTVNAGVNKITERLNSVSPAIVSRIDPEFVAAHDTPNALDGEALGSVGSLPETLDTAVGKLAEGVGTYEPRQLLGGVDEVVPVLGRGAEVQSGEQVAGALCISGCNDDAGLIGTGNSRGQRRLLGGLRGGGTSSGGAVLLGVSDLGGSNLGDGNLVGGTLGGSGLGGGDPIGGSDPGGGGTAAASAGGGLVSSTVNSTGSIVGGAVKSLTRR
jgi:hypothetical protein